MRLSSAEGEGRRNPKKTEKTTENQWFKGLDQKNREAVDPVTKVLYTMGIESSTPHT